MAIGDPVDAVRHKRHHRGPDAARGMFQAGMEAQGRRARKVEPPRAQIGLDERSLGHLRACQIASAAALRFRASASSSSASLRRRLRAMTESPPGRLPQAALPKGGDQITLVAAGMAAHQHLAVFARS